MQDIKNHTQKIRLKNYLANLNFLIEKIIYHHKCQEVSSKEELLARLAEKNEIEAAEQGAAFAEYGRTGEVDPEVERESEEAPCHGPQAMQEQCTICCHRAQLGLVHR